MVLLHGRDWRGDHDLVKFSYNFLDRVISGQARSDFTGHLIVHLPFAQLILQVLEYGRLLDIVAGFSVTAAWLACPSPWCRL